VARIGVVIVGLDVADAAVSVLELPLEDKIGGSIAGQSEVIVAGTFAVELDREVLVEKLTDRHMSCVKSHGRWPCFSAYQPILRRSFGESRCLGRQRQFVRGLDRVELGGLVVVKGTAAIRCKRGVQPG
jgi:hypothetical protein